MAHETDPIIDHLTAQRIKLELRHSQALARLMEERQDLRGVNALADLVADSLRWSA